MNLAKRKSFQAGLVVLIALAIVLAGTFAWFSFSQQALNIFEGFTNPGVNIHDIFPKPNGPDKDVYVENSGERPLYIRVRLDEFMTINGEPIDINEGGNANDPDGAGWHIHSYEGQPYVCGEEFHDYYDWVMGGTVATGDQNDGWRYYIPAPFTHQALFDQNGHQIREASAVAYKHSLKGDTGEVGVNLETFFGTTDDGSTYATTLETIDAAYIRIEGILNSPGTIPGTTIRDELNDLYDILDAASDRNERNAAQATLDTFLKDNNLGYYDMVYSVDESVDNEDGNYVFDSSDLIGGEIKFIPIKRTLQTEKVYTMNQWIAAGTPTGSFWVMDNDGWCYWGELLMPGQATGLLLSEVILNQDDAPSGVWWYGINVRLEAVDFEDYLKGTFLIDGNSAAGEPGITDQGQMVLDTVSGKYVFDIENPGLQTQKIHTYVNFKDNTYRELFEDGTHGPLFVYTGAVPPANNAMVKIAQTNYGTTNNAYRVGAKFYKTIPGETNATEFTIVKADYGTEGQYSGLIEGSDGKRYIKLSYTDKGGNTQTAWLAVGSATNKFEPLIARNPGPGWDSSDNNILIWSDHATDPSKGLMRKGEDAGNTLKTGDTFTIDSIDWLILGRKGDKTLIITKDVVGSEMLTSAALAAVETYDDSMLTDLFADDASNKAVLLTIQDVIDYFANNTARAAAGGEWWLSDGMVGDNGAVLAADTESHYIRPAIWIDTDKLQAAVESAS